MVWCLVVLLDFRLCWNEGVVVVRGGHRLRTRCACSRPLALREGEEAHYEGRPYGWGNVRLRASPCKIVGKC